jgi:diacylglycerol kinase (ATP)
MSQYKSAEKICVIFNPQAGRRRARKRLSRFLQTWQNRVEFWPTEFAGHGTELGRRAGDAGFSIVAAAGGDGTAHDVANGLLASDRQESTFAVVPIGSANDYAFSLRQQFGPSQLDDEVSALVDVGTVRAAQGQERYFIEAIGLGLNGQVTLESRKIHRLQGPFLYGLAAWRAVSRYPIANMSVQWDEHAPTDSRTMLLSVLLGAREGNFKLAPAAKLDDGLFDYVHARVLGRWEVARILPRLYFHGPPEGHPQITAGKCKVGKIHSDTALTIHVDGEMFCTPEDAVQDVEVRIIPGRLRVKLCPP